MAANRLSKEGQRLVRRLVVKGCRNAQIRKELSRHGHAANLTDPALSYYRRRHSEAQSIATYANEMSAEITAQRITICGGEGFPKIIMESFAEAATVYFYDAAGDERLILGVAADGRTACCRRPSAAGASTLPDSEPSDMREVRA